MTTFVAFFGCVSAYAAMVWRGQSDIKRRKRQPSRNMAAGLADVLRDRQSSD